MVATMTMMKNPMFPFPCHSESLDPHSVTCPPMSITLIEAIATMLWMWKMLMTLRNLLLMMLMMQFLLMPLLLTMMIKIALPLIKILK